MPPDRNLLLTGNPGIGKTTLMVSLAKALGDYHPAGFQSPCDSSKLRKVHYRSSMCSKVNTLTLQHTPFVYDKKPYPRHLMILLIPVIP